MKKASQLSLARIGTAPQRSEGTVDSLVQMLSIDLLLMLLIKKPQPSKTITAVYKNY
jgi:hypothetical protein